MRQDNWLAQGISRRLLISMLLLGGGICLVLSAIAFSVTYTIVDFHFASVRQHAIKDAREHLLASFNALFTAADKLAGSSLIATALTDSVGRDAYLVPFLRQASLPFDFPYELTVTDFEGRPLASNIEGVRTDYRDPALVDDVVGRGRAHLALTSGRQMLLALPVLFPATGSPEGMLVIECDLPDLIETLVPQLAFDLHGSVWLPAGSNGVEQGTAEADDVIAMTLQHGAQRLGTLSVRVPEDNRPLEKALRQVVAGALVVALTALLVIYLVVRRVAARLVSPLVKLDEVVQQVTETQDLSLEIPSEGEDEIARLGRSFNEMIRRLRDSHLELESRVQERTAELLLAQQEWERTFDAIPDLVVILDAGNRILRTNQAFRKRIGKSAAALSAKDLASVLPCVAEILEFVLQGGGVLPATEVHIARLAGDFEVEVTSCLDASGRPLERIFLAHDVGERNALQAQAIRNSQLAALGEMAAGVAHEINNPIMGIINYAQLLCNRSGEEPSIRDLTLRIIKEGERIASIVRTLLSVARHESAELTPCEAHQILEETLSIIGVQLAKDGIDLQLELPEQDLMLHCNRQQIEQVLFNVINNARYALNEKYPAPHPDKILRIGLSSVKQGGQPLARITLHDKGTGIHPKMIGRVLTPFVTTKPAGVGTGLGLSICHDIVKSHRGVLSIDSLWGSHTTVMIELPLQQSGSPA